MPDRDESYDPYELPNGPPGENEPAPPTPPNLHLLTARGVGPLIAKEVG